MNNILRTGKRAFTVAVATATIVWSVGAAVFVAPLAAKAAVTPLSSVAAGSLIKGDSHTAVYYYDGTSRYPFPNLKTYRTWYGEDFSSVVTVSMAELGTVRLAGVNVVYRPGSRLVKIDTSPFVYAVGPNGRLFWVKDEATATALYGSNWASKIEDVPDVFFTNYSSDPQDDLGAGALHPSGSLLSSGGKHYLVEGSSVREISDAAWESNGYSEAYLISANSVSGFSVGTAVAATEFASPAQSASPAAPGAGTGTGTTPVAQGSVRVELDSAMNAAGRSILADTTSGDGAEILIPSVALKFTAGSSDVKVKTVKFSRIGVAADADIQNSYIYDGNTRLAEQLSFSSKVITFSNASGLFTVPANSSKTIVMKLDLTNGTTGSKTIGFQVASATDVEADNASVSGTFPVAGNLHTTATVGDLGTISTSNTTTFPGTIDPGVTDRELWRFTLTSAAQDISVDYVKLTMIGTINFEDIKNLYLEVAGKPINEGKIALASDKTVVFDLSADPFKITAGQAKIVLVKGDVVNGAGRNFRFTIQRMEHFRAKDTNYGVYLKLNQANAFSVVDPDSTSDGTNVNSGRLTLGVAVDSPTGNIPDAATGVTFAKYTFSAVGEDVQVNSLNYGCTSTSNTLSNVKLSLEGVGQVGTTVSSLACDGGAGTTTSTFGNTFVIAAGTSKVLTVSGDTTHSTVAAGDTVAFNLGAGSNNAQGKATLSNISTTAQTARTLTVRGNTVTVAVDQSFANRTATIPTGTTNAKGIKIASFIVTAGSGESVDVTQMVMKDINGTSQMGDNFQNLKLVIGSGADSGKQIGATIGTLDTSGTQATYTFSPSPSIRIAAGDTLRVEVYADVRSSVQDAGVVIDGGATAALTGVVLVDSVSGSGVVTGADAGSTTDIGLQDAYIAASGNLTIALDAATPGAAQQVMGKTGIEMGRFKLTADGAENITITELVVSDVVSSAASGTLKNIKVMNGTEQVGSTVASFTTQASSTIYAVFSGLALNIPKSQSVVLKVFADVASYEEGGLSNSTHRLSVFPDYLASAATEAITAVGAQSGTSLTAGQLDFGVTDAADRELRGSIMTVYRTKLGIRWSSDTPSGTSSPSAEEKVAHLILSNTANSGNYDATVEAMNFNLSHVGISSTASRTLTLYLDVIDSSSDFTTSYVSGSIGYNFNDTNVVDGSFTDFTVSAGSDRNVYLTLDTRDAGSTDRLSITVGTGDIEWGDGITTSITTVNDLPLATKTLSY